MSVGVTTRLLDASRGRQFLSATLGQAYYFQDPRVTLPGEPVRDRSTSDVVAEVELNAFKNWNARFAYQWNPDETQSERSETFVQYNPSPGRVINAGYRFRRDLLEQVDVSGAWPITNQWRGFARWVYSLQEDKTLDQFLGVEYRVVLLGRARGHASLRLQPLGRCRNVDRPAAGTEGFVQCRSGQRSFPARSDSGILLASVRAQTLRYP